VKNKIKKYIIILLVTILSSLGYQTVTHEEKDEQRMDDEEHMFI
jgi:hypothetical protein|tara:strand:- start:13 stop:144 length:132 start_codon:yes stop_codon:yes gene_type:complete